MSPKSYGLILRQCRLVSGDVVDIAIDGKKIAAISEQIKERGEEEILIGGRLVCPPFVDSHIHLDSALTAGEPRWNESGTLFEGIKIWGERKQSLSLKDVKKRALETLKLQAMQGVLFVRSHADVSEDSLTALQALLDVREEVKDWITLQVVAFPQDGIYGKPENKKLLKEAVKMGADVVGGIPHYEFTREDGVKSIHKIFELAEEYNKLIDVHCDEIDDEQSRFLEVVAACALRSGMGEKVTASHTTAFGSYNDAYAYKLMGLLERSRINFIANPLINITLQGRMDSYPKRRGVTRVKELWRGGLNVSLGHDCVQDPWYSLGTGNMLDVAYMALHVCQMTGLAEIDACFDMVTVNGAKTLQLNDYGIAVGNSASLIILDAVSRFDAIRRRAPVCYVFSQGKLLAQRSISETKWHL
ncbi:cytosine deaminase [Ancylothrix sp. C2]|uniref:cytosine deaminase n=1 Tax=Ancylothrix sp. D3o TaxID=2953691 RepID=UPI0021BB46E7|nr:cytosine deaminase [Ancylothrix sp. D3o]MCT7951921.1 cytosine deaminase [Ancylothrix sp. D3o]